MRYKLSSIIIICFTFLVSCKEKSNDTDVSNDNIPKLDTSSKVAVVESISNAKNRKIMMSYLDSIYKNALNTDTSLAVFKTDTEQEKLTNAYGQFLQDFGSFLNANNYKWEQETSCWNRIYFKPDGTVDYFLYGFRNALSKEKEAEFKKLLSAFVSNNKIQVTAKVKFSQCSPVVYGR